MPKEISLHDNICYISSRVSVVKMVKDIPVLTGRETPTIAIITAMYCEKLAVDAMMENKVSFVQYKTEGEYQRQNIHEWSMSSVVFGFALYRTPPHLY